MAKRQVVSYSYTCDVCGGVIPESDGEGASRKLSWEGGDYVVDVCARHGSELGELLSQLKGFVDAGSRPGSRRGRKPAGIASASSTRAPSLGRRASASKSTASKAPAKAAPRKAAGPAPSRGEVAAIRIWARENGHTVNERGRIPGPVLAAYQAATGGGPAVPATPAPAKRRGRPRKVVAS